ncbi:hypothetical protein WJX79_002528 [Trebouxia sp. C0005]
MAEYDTFTREQLLEELCRTKAVKEKFKRKLELTQEKCTNIQPLLDGYKSLDEKHKQRVLECETLRSSNSILEKAHQDADRCAKEQDRRLKQLAHDLRQATERADKAEQSSKQAKDDCAQSGMLRKKLEHNLDDLKKQLRSLESALTTVKKQQQDDQRVITSLKAQASKPAEARAQAPNESMPSTQDRSGDTNDDRGVAQLRHELSGIRHQLAECHEQQGNWLAEMQGWRNTFALLGGVMPSAQIQAQQTASVQRQVSPVAAEGSNIMPRLAFRPEPTENRRPCHGSSPPSGACGPRESTPQAGSTAGDGEDVGRHDALGAGSDSMSNVESDATVVDFLELQLARITHCDEELGPELVSSVAQDICSAWQQSQCPLQCIISAFVCSFLECAAVPYAHSLPFSKRSMLGQASRDGEQEFDTQPEAEEFSVPQQQHQQQQQQGPDALEGPDKSVKRLDPCGLLNGLLQQVLHFLRQSCLVPFPGPFQTEVCCLSATAATLCRLTGKSAALRALVLNALRDPDMWGFEQVTGALMGQTMRATLPAASEGDKWALSTMSHLLRCMKHAAGNCKAAAPPKYKQPGVEVEEI